MKRVSIILIFALAFELFPFWDKTVFAAPLSISEIIELGGGGECYAERNPQNKSVGNDYWAPCCNCCQKGGTKGFLLQAFDPKTGKPLGGEFEKIFEKPITANGGVFVSGDAAGKVGGQLLGFGSQNPVLQTGGFGGGASSGGLGGVSTGIISSALSGGLFSGGTITAIRAVADALGFGYQGLQVAASLADISAVVAPFVPFVAPFVSLVQGNFVGAGLSLVGAATLGPVGAAIGGLVGSVFGGKKCVPVGCLNSVCKKGNAIWDPATGTCGCDQPSDLTLADLEEVTGSGFPKEAQTPVPAGDETVTQPIDPFGKEDIVIPPPPLQPVAKSTTPVPKPAVPTTPYPPPVFKPGGGQFGGGGASGSF